MNSSGNKTMIGSAMLFALLLLVSTGCTKEEVVAPNTPVPVLQTKAGSNPTMGTGNQGSDTSAPISDDGDDIGDSERSNRPRN